MEGILAHFFDAIYVISLDHREDRRIRLAEEMRHLGLAEPSELTWIRAVSGEQCWAPGFFGAGAGAWGCLQSHLRVLQDAIMDGKESILVLEDDVTFHPRAAAMLDLFFKQVPQDWDQLFLGGEHFEPPEQIKFRPFIFRATCVHRTHAYALRRKALPLVYQHAANYPDYIRGGEWHVDHQLGAAHKSGMWATYTPSWWIAGQKGGESNIAERRNPDLWWHPEVFSRMLPYVWTPASCAGEAPDLPSRVHFGNNLTPGTFQDIGLDKCVDDRKELVAWLELIAKEAISLGLLPGISHPGIPYQVISSIWPAGVVDAQGADLAALGDYPFNGLFTHPLNASKSKLRPRIQTAVSNSNELSA